MDLSGKRILIVKPSSMGDVVHTLPLVHAIKRCYPDCHVGWIVQRAFQGLLGGDPSIDELIPISIPSTSDPGAPRGTFIKAFAATLRTLVHLRKELRNRAFDLVLDLHASFRSGLLGMTNPDGIKVGFADAKELNTWFQGHLLNTDPAKPHAVDKNLVFAQFLGCPPRAEDFRILSHAGAREKVRLFLKQAAFREGDRLVYANPTARWKTKFWTVPAWAKLADMAISQEGVRVVFGGGPRDVPYIEAILRTMKESPVVAAGKLSLAESVALIEAADVYVGVDSGPMHIAAFVGTPVVALFGPTDPALVGPYGDAHRVIVAEDLDCLACRKRSCTDRRCLEGITAQRVLEEALKFLDG